MFKQKLLSRNGFVEFKWIDSVNTPITFKNTNTIVWTWLYLRYKYNYIYSYNGMFIKTNIIIVISII